VAARTFLESERRGIEVLPPERRTEAFVTCWTRKEACVKALGLGVWSAFDRFEVSVEPGAPARLLAVDGSPSAAEAWSLVHLEPAPGYVGALAVPGHEWQISARTLDSSEANR
jgi:4'-phosphopantetheinyl transferase